MGGNHIAAVKKNERKKALSRIPLESLLGRRAGGIRRPPVYCAVGSGINIKDWSLWSNLNEPEHASGYFTDDEQNSIPIPSWILPGCMCDAVICRESRSNELKQM